MADTTGMLFTRSFAANVQHNHEQFLDQMMLAGATAARVQFGGRILYYVWDQAQRLWKCEREEVEGSPPPSPGSSEPSEPRPRDLDGDFENLTPDEPTQPPRQVQVAAQVQRMDNGQQMIPVDAGGQDGDVQDEQTLHIAQLARTHAGKRTTETGRNPRTDPDIFQDPKRDPYQQIKNDKQKMQTEPSSSKDEVAQLRDEWNTMKAIVASLIGNNNAQTPMYTNIATPLNATGSSTTPIDYQAVWAAIIMTNITNNQTNSKTVVQNGVVYRAVNSPSEADTPDVARETGQLCQMGGNGGNGGGFGGDPNDDGDNMTIVIIRNSNCRKSVFVLVKFTNIIITTFSGTNLTINPYMLF